MVRILSVLALSACLMAQNYDVLLKNGHVIDPKNNINAVRDVAIKDQKIAAVAANIDPSQAKKVVDVKGLYVMPGLIDLHVHTFYGDGPSYRDGQLSVIPDSHHLSQRRHHRCRRRYLRLAQLRSLQKAHRRPVQDPRAHVPEHRRRRHGRRGGTEHARHGSGARRRDDQEVPGVYRRRQNRALRRPGMDRRR